jgi:hypothetical protein
MHFKTIALETLRQYPEVYRKLRENRAVLPALDNYASELKTSHEAWTHQLFRKHPGLSPMQIRSQALELATRELKEHLRSASPPSAEDDLSLDDAMNFLRKATPTA